MLIEKFMLVFITLICRLRFKNCYAGETANSSLFQGKCSWLYVRSVLRTDWLDLDLNARPLAVVYRHTWSTSLCSGGDASQISHFLSMISVSLISEFQARFNKVQGEVAGFIRMSGYNVKGVAFVPISGGPGENMIEPSHRVSADVEFGEEAQVV